MAATEEVRSAREVERELRQLAANLPSFVQVAVFVILGAPTVALAVYIGRQLPGLGIAIGVGGFIGAMLISAAIKVANQWEKGIVLRLGEFQSIRGPGVFLIAPIIDRVRMIDMRVQALDIPWQEVITRDNVPVSINGALFFQVKNVEAAVMRIQDFVFSVSLLAQTALRDVIGGMTLDELLSERERISKMIESAVEKESGEWGLHVSAIRLLDIDMPEDLKRIMSRQAAAEREKRATITKAEGDKLAAENLAAAAATMHASPGAMQLRTLQTIDGLGPTASNTVVLAVPIEIIEMVRRVGGSAVTQNG
jgi:regulator of protease activity HflC (stomatin/prohibitin superfamily)